ncbi:MAG: glycosyltransferase family 9 protein [Cytophagales bacterium]
MKFLVIQTAFIGDAILATAVLEKIHTFYPKVQIDYLIRKGNEQLFDNHPFINKLWIWNKKRNKLKSQIDLILQIRKVKYDYIINCQRYLSSGIFSIFSGANETVGFDKNPVSFLFTKIVKHHFDGTHEVARNQKLIAFLTNNLASKPRLYPPLLILENRSFVTISPSSVWFTKQFPEHKWIEFIDKLPLDIEIYLLGAANDKSYNEHIIQKSTRKTGIFNKAGLYSLLDSAALMQKAKMNYVNDSAPMHLCSAVNAPVCVVYCSTVSEFGYGPLSDISHIVETKEALSCRPCGIHGHKTCPEMHFKCAKTIDIERLIHILET